MVLFSCAYKDAEQQEQWEKQMEEMHEKRMTEFAQARPSEDTKEAFYISPQLKDNPLMAQSRQFIIDISIMWLIPI